MASAYVKVDFPADVQTIWKIVTSMEDCSWRSDLSRIEVLSETQFVEYTKDGTATTFTVTAMEPGRRWEFDMENGNMRGHWTGLFSQNGGQTTIEFTEQATAKKWLMKPFVGLYLRRQQKAYVKDLQREIRRRDSE